MLMLWGFTQLLMHYNLFKYCTEEEPSVISCDYLKLNSLDTLIFCCVLTSSETLTFLSTLNENDEKEGGLRSVLFGVGILNEGIVVSVFIALEK